MTDRPGVEELEELEEPSQLGAAATLPVDEARRPRTARVRTRRAARAEAPTTPGYDGVEYVFEPNTRAMPPLREYLASVWERRRFISELARADLRGRRSSTLLGGVWSLLDPLFQAGVYYMLFAIIRPGGRPLDFLHVLIAGMFLFQLAMSALNEGGNSVRQAKGLMLNSAFPRAVLPLTAVYKGVLRLLEAVPIYIFFHVVLGAPTDWDLLLFPLVLALQVLFLVGVAMLTATLVVYFRDAQNAVQYLARVLLFASPIIYPVSVIPDDIRPYIAWQPLFAFHATYQEIFGPGSPGVGDLLQIIGWSAAFLVVGVRVFLTHERDFAIRL